jgi:hypothetical protein
MNRSDLDADSPGMSDLERVRDLLPWYAMGALPPADREFIAQWLAHSGAQHPDILAELAWLRRTGTQLQAEAAVPAGLAEQGLEALMQRVRADQAGRSLPAAVAPAAPSWVQQLRDALQSLLGTPVRLALASVVLAQAVAIGLLLQRQAAAPGELESLGGGAGATMAQEVRLTVAFAPGATEAGMRDVLLQAQARIVAGPSALGLYTLAVPAARAQASLDVLRAATGVVESVQR